MVGDWHMAIKKIIWQWILFLLLTAGLTNAFAAQVTEASFSGIIEYVFEPNPLEITPKLYNWEIQLNSIDSRTGSYEIVQITKPINAQPKGRESAPSVLIDNRMIVPNQDGIIRFKLYIGEKQPKPNMPGPGSIGEPLIFSGRGTGKGESNWIYLPGSKVDSVVPSPKGTRMSDGKLNLIQFIVTKTDGEKFQTDVMLRRK
jgi:hypothetical protein